VMTT